MENVGMDGYAKEMKLNLDGDTFAALKLDFANMLQGMLHKMQNHGGKDATITIKLGIELLPSVKEVHGGPIESISVPRFRHEIKSAMQFQNSTKGKLDGNFELIFDAERGEHGEYIMREIKDEQGQISMDDYANSGGDGDE